MSNESVKESLVKQEFGAVTRTTLDAVDLAASSAAASAKASIEARYIMAMRNPRNWDQVRVDLEKECSRPSFANDKSSLYHKPIGEGIEGLGIRFAEVAVRCMTNVLVQTPTTYEDDVRRKVSVTVTDLESNVTYEREIVVNKTVERLQLSRGQIPLSSRVNSSGETTYTVAASEDALINKEGAQVSKAMRTNILRLVPGDLQDSCTKIIKKIRKDKITEDPDAAKRGVIDAFAKMSVSVVDLENYLEHPVAQCTPDELMNLRALYGALADGEATWKSVMDNAEEMRAMRPKDKAKADKSDKGVDAAKAKIEQEKAKATPAQTTTTTQPKADPKPKAATKQEPKPEQAPAAKTEPVAGTKVEPKAETKAEPPAWAAEKETAPVETPEAETETALPVEDEKPAERVVRIVRKDVPIYEPIFISEAFPKYTAEQEELARTECRRLNTSLEKNVNNMLRLSSDQTIDLKDINGVTLDTIIQILKKFQTPAAK